MNQSNEMQGLWIPLEILQDTNLSLQEKFILSMIKALDKNSGCFATNKYFAELLQVKERRVSEIVNSLKDKGYITSEIQDNYKRTIRVVNVENQQVEEEAQEEQPQNNDEKVIRGTSKKKIMFGGVDLLSMTHEALKRAIKHFPEIKELLRGEVVFKEVDSEWDGVKQLILT